MYTVIALIVLLSAVWIGLNFANYLVAPIRRLIGAAKLVSTGNLYVQVPIRRSEGDLAQLGETFNKMTQELRTQRDDIVRARDLIDSRRRFTEAVLAGASAGVIGVDARGPHQHPQPLGRAADRLHRSRSARAQPLAEIVPELAEHVQPPRAPACSAWCRARSRINRNGRERNLSVRVTSEQSGAPEHGYVVTLDDITELVTRAAHLGLGRRRPPHRARDQEPAHADPALGRAAAPQIRQVINDDAGVFEQCTDTIVRQVDDIKRMVDEFSRFARMPKPVIAAEDVADTVRQVVFLQRVGNADIDIDVEIAEDPMPARFDRRLISQALTNIIKNATEAIAAVPPAELGRGHIRVSAAREGEDIVIDVVDNGIGLPKENRSRLLEPYVTTREKGTGLGLAIVGRILEEHGGRIELRDAAAEISRAARRLDAAALCGRDRRSRRARGRARTHDPSTSDECVSPWQPTSSSSTTKPISASWSSGILQDEGYVTRTARDSDDALAPSPARRPNLVFLDIWLQGSRLDGLQLLDAHEAAAPGAAGGDDLGSRQHRDRGRRHQAGRLRLHREAVQGRPAGAGRASARWKPRGSSARSRRSSNCRPRPWSASRRR